MPQIDPVILQLRADVADYNAKVGAATSLTEQRMTKIEAAGFRMGTNLRKGFDLAKVAAVGFLSSIALSGILSAARAGLDYAASLGEIAQSLGVTTGFLQEFRFAATQSGASIDAADEALNKFNITIGKALSSSGPAREALTGLGIDMQVLAKASDSERFAMVADAIARIPDPAQQAAAAVAIFGRGARDIIPLLQKGAQGFRIAAAEARQYGIVLSDNQLQSADELADKLAALNMALSAKIADAILNNAAAIGSLVNSLVDLASWAVRAGNNYAGFIANVSQRGLLRAVTDSLGGQSSRFAGARGDVVVKAKKAADLLREAAAATKNGSSSARQKRGAALVAVQEAEAAKAAFDRGNRAPPRVDGTGVVAPGKVSGGGGGSSGGGGARSTGKAAQDLARIEAQFKDDLARAYDQLLALQAELLPVGVERFTIERERAANASRAAIAEINADKDRNATQRATLVAAEEKRALAEFDLINRRENTALEEQSLQVARAVLDAETETLQSQEANARSAAEAQVIALRLVDLAFQRERADLDAIIASKASTDAERKIAAAKLATLDAREAQANETTKRRTQGPLEQYRDRITLDANQMNEALQDIAVDGLQSLNNGLADAIANSKDLGDVFKNVANAIIADLIRIAVQQVVIRPLLEALGGALGGGGGGGGGGLFGAIGGILGTPIGGRASGGYVGPNQMVRVNEQRGGAEYLRMGSQGGQVIPLGQVNQSVTRQAPASNGVATVQLMLSDDIDARIVNVSGPVAVEVLRAGAPGIVNAATQNTLNEAGKFRI